MHNEKKVFFKSQAKQIGLAWLFCFLYSFCAYPVSKENKISEIKSVSLISNIPIVIDGILHNQTDSLVISYYKKFVIYRISVTESFSKLETDQYGNILNDKKWKNDTIVYNYFIHHQDSAFGLKYKRVKYGLGQRMLVDSFIKMYAFGGIDLYKNIYKQSEVEKINTDNYSYVERLVMKNKIDERYADTVLLYFSNKNNFDGIEISLSKKLDSLKDKKLVKSRFIYNPIISIKYSFPMPARTFWFELSKKTSSYKEKEQINMLVSFK